MLSVASERENSSVHPVAETAEAFRSQRTLEQHLPSGVVRLLRDREHAFTAGDARTHVVWVESGTLCLYKVMRDGRRQVIDFAYPGTFIGLGVGTEHSLNAQALEPVRLRAVPVSTVAHLASRDPDLGMKLYEALSRELGAAHEHLFTVGQRNAAERVACFLLSLARRQGGGQRETLVLPMTRLDIADFLGLTIETVSRTLTRLKTAKIIDLEQCTLVRLVDIAKLEQLAAGEASLS